MAEPEKTSNQLAAERTELAHDRSDLATTRTVMAADRTLMAWVRTGLSMISFGFTIYKVLQAFQASGAILPHEHSPRDLGMFLTGLGSVSIVIGTIEYRYTMRQLRSEHGVRLWRPAYVTAIVMSIGGLFLFISIISKIL